MTEIEIIAAVALFATFFGLLCIGLPVVYCIGISSTLALVIHMDLIPAVTTICQRMTVGIDSFTLLAIPFFVLAGELMKQGGIADRLINLARAIIGRLPGGLSYVNILSAMLFGAVSGSAVAAASAIGSIMTDRMEDEGYPRTLSASINISASTTGLLIPPSNILIVYALASGGTASVAALFVAGYLPGLLIGLGLMLTAGYVTLKHKLPRGAHVPLKTTLKYFKNAFWSLTLLVVVVGGIVAGIFTATEAAAIAVLYAAILAFIYKTIRIRDLSNILLNSGKTTAMVMAVISTSMAMSWLFSFQGIPQAITSFLLDTFSHPVAIFLIINLILLVIGTFMDISPAVLIFTPIFLPVVTKLGMDPVHFGIVIVLNLCIGICTPPVGTLLFVGSGIAKVNVSDVIKPLLPFLFTMIMVLLMITYFPKISLFLPQIFGL